MASTQEQYAALKRSRELHEAALKLFPGGVLHWARETHPFPLYFPYGKGSHKWDADGNEYIDYHLGSAALLLGHQHPEVVKALERQLPVAYHLSKGHPLEVEWGQRVQSLVPNAERIRFVNSGTEATMLAMRVARAYTGKRKVMRFHGHYDGWHDYALAGLAPPYDALTGGGVPEEVMRTVAVAPSHDIEAVERIVQDDPEIGAALVEASGPSYGRAPLPPGFLQTLREITRERGILLILDEVITGFRWSPGGAQVTTGVDADIVALGKIVSGGMPGAAMAGRAEVMGVLESTGDPHRDRYQRVFHGGTFNGNPLAAAAGIATLDIAATGEPQRRADAAAARLRQGLNDALQRANVAGCAYGDSSTFHIYFGECPPRSSDAEPLWTYDPFILKGYSQEQVEAVHQALQVRGVDPMSHLSGVTCSEHTEEDIDRTVAAFADALPELLDQGIVQRRR